MIKQTIAVAALVAVGATVAFAQASGPAAVSARKELMKEMNTSAKAQAAVAKGEAPFDAAKAQAFFKTVETDLGKFKAQFPADSKDGETRAAPAIWEKKADFEKAVDKAIEVAKTAQTAAKDEASFKVQFQAMNEACDSCHKDFRTARR
jgi:cytochrome c556